MGEQQQSGRGDIINNGTIQGQNFSIGPGSSVQVTVTGTLSQDNGSNLDLRQIKASLTELHQLLAEAPLPVEDKMRLQTLTGQAAATSEQPQPKAEALAEQVKQLGKAFQETGETIAESASIRAAILKIASLVGPLVVGGARAVASWFGGLGSNGTERWFL